MKDADKSRAQLLYELDEARQRIAQLERLATHRGDPAETMDESRARYRNLFENAQEGILITGIATRRMIYANPAFVRLLGYSLEELRALPLETIHPPEEHEYVIAEFEAQARGESTATSNLPCRRKSGTLIYADVTATLGLVEAQECVINFFRDVTERKLAEDEFRKFKAIADDGCFGVVLASPDGRISYVNEPWARMVGSAADHLVGRTVEEFLPLADATSDQPFEVALQRVDGASLPVLMSRSVIEDHRGRPSFIGLAAVDIARRVEAEEKLTRTLQELRRSSEDMLAVVNQFRAVTLMVDEKGHLTFVSRAGEELLTGDDALGRPWHAVLPLSSADRTQLELMAGLPAQRRSHLPVRMETPGGRHYWMEAEIHDDPRDARRKILFFYDVTQVHHLRSQLDHSATFHDIISHSEAMRQVCDKVSSVAGVDWTLLVEGETGVGKELVARAIHASSARRDQPFIAVNCAGLTESLLGSQLFGHKKGAFTGAVADQKGIFEAADGGTVFLDEIGDISPGVQMNLLRVLESHEVTRIGESTPRKVDVRIITATNRDLAREVREDRFRADLLYRIRAGRIVIPPLRERRADIPVLAAEFLRRCCAGSGKEVQAISAPAMRRMMEHAWPGNVRELKGAMEYAVLHCAGDVVGVDDLPPELADSQRSANSPPASPQDERELMLTALREAGGNRTAAARLMGVSRATFYRRLVQLGLDESDA